MRAFLVFSIVLATAPPTALADAWDRAIQDSLMLEELMENDRNNLENEQSDLQRELELELFPVTGEEDIHTDGLDPFSLSDTNLTIKIDGVPTVLADVELNSWFTIYVRDVANRKIISGYRDHLGQPTGTFGPADNVTIEQLAKMSVVAAHIDRFSCGETLVNTDAKGRWSEQFMRCAESNGWAVYSDGSVDPGRPATRAEVVVTVLQAFGARISPRSGTLFSDVTTSTEYAAPIETAASAGVVSGYTDFDGRPTGFFGPVDSVNRAETAKIFSLAFQVYGK